MAMLTDLQEKLAIELEDDNLMLVEDVEGSKKIKISELKKAMTPVQERFVKEIVNETIDRVVKTLLDAKWQFTEYDTMQYRMNVWISDNSGDVQIVLYDMQEEKCLTREEIEELFKNKHSIRVYIGTMWEEPVSVKVLSFCEEYDDPEGINEFFAEDDAGLIRVHFNGLTNNQISQIYYEDIEMAVQSDDDKIRYEFTIGRGSFMNSVPYESRVPVCCPCIYRPKPNPDPDADIKKPEQESPNEPEPEQPEEPKEEGEEPKPEPTEPEDGDENESGEEESGNE